MRTLLRAGTLAAAAVAIAMSGLAPARAAAPILIKSCTIAKPKPFSHVAGGTNITFVNLGRKTISSITFLVGYRNASQTYLRHVEDVGSFAPGATIEHRLNLYNDVTYAGTQTMRCMPTRVKYSDATLWVAPAR